MMLDDVGGFNLTWCPYTVRPYKEYFIRKLTPSLNLRRHKQMIVFLFMVVRDPLMVQDRYTGSSDNIKSLC